MVLQPPMVTGAASSMVELTTLEALQNRKSRQ
jgi:hypothetical protein